ncbi:zinc ribbon-containing protein [Methylomonas sp. EFPC1]|uniref:zinc ribbon-containing protein n=1 Tax=Methylomonas sp. EFPC1 TaxID=2812647 RepID=UPI001967ED7E|nr:zinc ribbon-containing protein [Methylomonas sp. EFPC1]QSB02535.1 zinc ribbon-containing protein [Methylomonas sp. EFPC1]
MGENKLIKAYDDLMGHLYEALDDTLHTVADALEIAKEKTSALGGHTQEEINKIADYVMRDVEHVATAPSQQDESNSLSEWLKFDIDLIENFALDAFMDIADKTKVKLAALEMEAKLYHPYKSGEVAGPGTFVCDACGKQIAFKSTSVIPACPECKGGSFSRV